MSHEPYTQYTEVLTAALAGGEDEVREALSHLDMGELSRLRNAMRVAADYAEDRRKHLWRSR